ncbi:MAG: hypothetical protein E7213_02570 [Clostridium sp.]|nr:hypothetical protein [Clostridium sp.]
MKTNYRALFLIADNLADLYEDGISLILSLDILLELPINKEYKKSLINVKNSVIKGNSLGKSFYENSKLYPDFFCGIVDLGESSGELVSALRNLRDFYFNVDKVKKKVKNSIRYPLFVLCALFVLCIMFLMIIIPNLYETFNLMNKDASKTISFFYGVYAYIKNNKIYSFVTFMCGVFILALLYKYIKSIHLDKQNKIFFKIKFLRQYYEYIFMRILSIIVNSGIEISKGLELCVKSVDMKCIKKAIEQLKEEVLLGNEMSETLKKIEFLSSYSLSMIAIGEKGGNIDDVLKKASQRLECQLLRRLEKLVSYVMPAAIVLVSSMIMMFVFAFVIPIFDMIYSGVV